MSKKGFAALEVIAGIVILAILVTVTTNTQVYLAVQSSKVLKGETYIFHIEEELTDIYYTNSMYEEKTIETKVGDLSVTMENLGSNEYNNNISKVTFQAEDFKRTYEVERSQYYVK